METPTIDETQNSQDQTDIQSRKNLGESFISQHTFLHETMTPIYRDEFDLYNREKGFNRVSIILIKLAALAVGFILFYYFKSQPTMRGINPAPICINDLGINAYTAANDVINDPRYTTLRDTLEMSSSMLIDMSFLFMVIAWIKQGEHGGMYYMIASFYIMRAVVQGFFKFRFLKGYYWGYPGIPSLVVPYGDTSDFYYSGHTGFMVMIACSLNFFGFKTLSIVAVGFMVFVVQILLIYRGHYSIDLAIGALAALYSFHVVQGHERKIDGIFRKFVRLFIPKKKLN